LGGQQLFNATALSDLTTASPKVVANFGAAWHYGIWSATVHEIIYGPSSEWESDNGDSKADAATDPYCSGGNCYYLARIGTIPITNLELGLEALKDLKFSVGAVNLFNRYPEQIPGVLTAAYYGHADNAGVTKYPGFSSIGIDGGFYYGRVSYHF